MKKIEPRVYRQLINAPQFFLIRSVHAFCPSNNDFRSFFHHDPGPFYGQHAYCDLCGAFIPPL
jgi:hypothetical protein